MDRYICPYCGAALDPKQDIKQVPTRDYDTTVVVVTRTPILVICKKCLKILGVA